MPLLDTWAWVEYFQGSEAGSEVRKLVEHDEPATCILSFAELSDLHARAERPGVDGRLAFIASRGPVLDVSRQAAQRAGATKWAQRRKGHAMGLGDAVIYEVAREHDLEVVTGDEGFHGLEGVKFLSPPRRPGKP
jgi:predicted nucleic acid-binding protein